MPLLAANEIPKYVNRLVTGQIKAIAHEASTLAALIQTVRPVYTVTEQPIYGVPAQVKDYWNFKPMAHLAGEDPKDCLVLACSDTDQATWKAVSKYGDFPVMHTFSFDFLGQYLSDLNTVPNRYRRINKNKTGQRAIIVRGAIETTSHIQTVFKIAQDYPDDLIIVSTWNETSKEFTSLLEDACDILLLCERPNYSGVHNKNYQLALIHAGLEAAIKSNAEKCLICRTDLIPLKNNTLNYFDHLMRIYPAPEKIKKFQKGRLIIPDVFTRKYLPFNAGDLLTYGYLQDVVSFWSASSFDSRTLEDPSFDFKKRNPKLPLFAKSKAVVECYFTLNYFEHINYNTTCSMENWIDILKNFYIVVNCHEHKLFWTRRNFCSRTLAASMYKSVISHQDWVSMQLGSFKVNENLDQITWYDFASSPWD